MLQPARTLRARIAAACRTQARSSVVKALVRLALHLGQRRIARTPLTPPSLSSQAFMRPASCVMATSPCEHAQEVAAGCLLAGVQPK
jgi:hypothetical protein